MEIHQCKAEKFGTNGNTPVLGKFIRRTDISGIIRYKWKYTSLLCKFSFRKQI